MYDNAASDASKKLVEVSPDNFGDLLEPHSGCSFYLFASTVESVRKEQKADKRFTQNGTIWQQLLHANLKRTDQTIKLDSFYLFEWFPRCPGLYYTEHGRKAREEASRSIVSIENGVVVYNPYGKKSMLDGGIGSIRLRPVEIEGSKYYLMSASSTTNCDQGFPLAVPETFYNKHIEEITERGAVLVDLWGKLIHIPEKILDVYTYYKGVPKLLLKIDDIIIPVEKPCQNDPLSINVAVSFTSNFGGDERVYASYVSFDPSSNESFNESIRWLQDDYVERRYKGVIITDFDETMEHFSNASFSLSKIMNFKLDVKDMQKIPPGYNFMEYLILQKKVSFNYINHQNIEYVEKKQNIEISGGQVGFIGDNVNLQDLSQNQSIVNNEFDLTQLAEELLKVRMQAKDESSTLEQEAEIGTLASAEIAARSGDKSKAIQLLSKAGKWTFDIATKVGTSLVAALIKDAWVGK